MPTYTDALPRNTWDKHGERVSILDYMMTISDPAAAINAAIQFAVGERGGCSLQIPVGTYIITSPIYVNKPNIIIYGEGENSILQRGADMPDNEAMFMVTAPNALFKDFLVDGMVITPEPFWLADPAFDGDPLNPILTKNTSFRVQASQEALFKIRFERVTIQHTGGYAILFDATQNYIIQVRIIDCRFANNRPSLLGVQENACNYGTWNGGILCEGNGTLAAVHDLLMQGCAFMRNTGNCFWTHLYDFQRLHSDIRCKNNDFLDIGRDGIMMGGVSGGVVEGNTMRRMGYIALDDVNTAEPRWLSGQWAVGIDTSGLTIGVNYVNNVLTSCNGGYIDCDGYGHGTIVGNKCRTPAPGDYDYNADQVGVIGWGGRQFAGGPDWAYGINVGNTSHAYTDDGARGVTVVGNQFQNMGRGAIDFYATRDSYVSDNDIYVPQVPAAPPITLGNLSYGETPPAPNTRTINCTIVRNRFHYAPQAYAPCIFEDAVVGGFGQPWQQDEGNVVFGNEIISETFLAYEFERDPTSTSNTAQHYSSKYADAAAQFPQLTRTSTHVVQREGWDVNSSSVLRWYNVDGGTVQLHMQLQAFSKADYRNPLLNVSRIAEANTGCITTGDRVTTGFEDVVATGKLYSDAFWCLASYNFVEAEANLLDATVGLVRYRLGTPNRFQVSVSVDGSGHRVWQDFGSGGGAIGGEDHSIIYNDNGSSAGDTKLQWYKDEQVMLITAKPVSPGINVKEGYITSDLGYVAARSGWNAFNGASFGAGAWMAGIGVASYYPPPPEEGQPVVPPNGGYIGLTPLGYANYPVPLKGITEFGADNVLLWNAGQNDTPTDKINATTGLMCNSFINAAAGFVTLGPYSNMIQATVGGISGRSLKSERYTHLGTLAADPDPAANMTVGDELTPGLMYWNFTTNNLRVYNGAEFVNVATGGAAGNPGGVEGSVQFRLGATFGGTTELKWDNTEKILTILADGDGTGQGLIVSNGYTQSHGFLSDLNHYQAFNGSAGSGALMSGYGLVEYADKGGYIDIAPLIGKTYPNPLPPLSAFGSNDVIMWVGAANGAAGALPAYGLMVNSYINARVGFATLFDSYQSIQAPNGGINARSVAVTHYTQVGHGTADPPVLTTGDVFQAGAMYWSDTLHGLMMYNGAAWIMISAGGASGAFGSVQYNKDGAFAGDSNLQWNWENQVLYVKGKTGTAAILSDVGFIQSNAGFLSNVAHWAAINGASSGSGAWLAGYSVDSFNNTGGYVSLNPLGYANYPVPLIPLLSFASNTVLLWASGQNATVTPNTSIILNTNAAIWSAVGFVTLYEQYNVMQAPRGGLNSSGSLVQPYNSRGGYNALKPLGYANYPIMLSGFDPGTDTILLWAAGQNGTTQPITSIGLICNAWIDAAVGFASAYNSFTTIHVDNGGIRARSIKAMTYSQLGHSNGVPGLTAGDAYEQGAIYWDDAKGSLQIFNGSTWGSPGGLTGLVATRIPYWNGSVLTDSANLWWDPGTSSLVTSAIGINGLSVASQLRITHTTADYGAFFTTTSPDRTHWSAGVSFNGSTWIAKSAWPSIVGIGSQGNSFNVYASSTAAGPGSAWSFSEIFRVAPDVCHVYSQFAEAFRVYNPGSGIFGGALLGTIGVNGPTVASQVRISNGNVDGGMFLTTVNNNVQATISRGASLRSDGVWIAKSGEACALSLDGQTISFHGAGGLGVGGAFNWTQFGYIASWGLVLFPGGLYFENNKQIFWRDLQGNHQPVFTFGSDNNFYFDNYFHANDIFIRPANGRYVFIGMNQGGWSAVLAPSQTGYLGNGTYRWQEAHINNLTVYGTLSGNVSTQTGNFGRAGAHPFYGPGGVATVNISEPPPYYSSIEFHNAGRSEMSIAILDSYTMQVATTNGSAFEFVIANPQRTAWVCRLQSSGLGAFFKIDTGSAVMANTGWFYWRDTGGNERGILTLWNDNNFYIDNQSGNDIFVRLRGDRYVFFQAGQVSPIGNNSCNLGEAGRRWGTLFVTNLNFSGSGAVRTLNVLGWGALEGGVVLQAGSNVSMSQSGNTIIINATGGGGSSYNQNLNTFNDVTFNNVTSSGVVQAAGATSFQNTNFRFQVNSNGDISGQSLNLNGVRCVGPDRVWVQSVQTNSFVFGGRFGVIAGGDGGQPVNAMGRDLQITVSGQLLIFRGGILTQT